MHTPLNIKNTPNCQPHPWHPSVIYVEKGWNGHQWWMAQTPFPPFDMAPYRDRYELPCIHFSDDGIRWSPIEGNPIDDIDDDMVESHNYLSDPHLVLRNGKLECYYRLSLLKDRQLVGNKTLLLRKTSTDGHNWSDREVVADLRSVEDIAIWGEQIISQAVLWHEKQYRCWYVDRSSYLKNRKILMTTSEDGNTWQHHIECHLHGCPDIDPWHLDVQYYDGRYQMLLYDRWELHWLDSTDGIEFNHVSKVLSPTLYFEDFYARGLYRACSVKVGSEIRVFFSAKTEKQSFIGQMATRDRVSFRPINGISKIKYTVSYVVPQLSATNIKRFVKKHLRQMGLMSQP